jgi:tripeptidyl-peptidase-1
LAGPEADLDTQFAFGLTYPTPGTFYSTGGSPPFTADDMTPTNTNEPYDDVGDDSLYPHLGICVDATIWLTSQWLQYMLKLPDNKIPPTISTSYADQEQTGNDDTYIWPYNAQCCIESPEV